jgi:hypothetical protein
MSDGKAFWDMLAEWAEELPTPTWREFTERYRDSLIAREFHGHNKVHIVDIDDQIVRGES